jgi:hypothetical protein
MLKILYIECAKGDLESNIFNMTRRKISGDPGERDSTPGAKPWQCAADSFPETLP